MSMSPSGPPATGGPLPDAASAAPASVEVPALADGVQLLGPAQGSGYREPPALVRRADGQTIQLTPLLYAVLAEWTAPAASSRSLNMPAPGAAG